MFLDYKVLYTLIFGTMFYFYKKNNIDMIMILVIISLLLFKLRKNENNMELFQSEEAIQNIASMYNAGTIKATNIELTGFLKTPKIQVNELGVEKIDCNELKTKTVNIENNISVNGNINISKDKKIISAGNLAISSPDQIILETKTGKINDKVIVLGNANGKVQIVRTADGRVLKGDGLVGGTDPWTAMVIIPCSGNGYC